MQVFSLKMIASYLKGAPEALTRVKTAGVLLFVKLNQLCFHPGLLSLAKG